ncbi:hypothetical protein LY90DRAFT_706204 [Neocallimastix californiae]|jgi:hypothetical protein|uniref:Extracellular membrane protein CFEM domain-containing protein n=1 Tax=Neocallimastix californiae TaxID=1754190 RepID=A0A1Y2ATY2_9FUNG|nr:hypothetical protein LY90DRAFT_706204 [Neocallimastix californiae]|eukprot:ORY26001.1 hypothetical protein LY90DRAFT_706204 [Neocallimastix californiae]
MRFTQTLLLALSAVAIRSAVVTQDNSANNQNAQNAQNTQANTQDNGNNNNQNNNKLTPEAQCVINNNCNQDIACIARCYNVPAPTNDMVFQTNDCAIKCPDPTVDSAGYLKCYNDCVDNFYMGNNVNAGTANTVGNNGNANTTNGNNANGNANTNGNNANGNNANGNNANGNINNGNTINNGNSTNANGNGKLNNGNTVQANSASSMGLSALAIATAIVALIF